MKHLDPKYSQRYFAKKMAMKSPGYYLDIINGRRNLSLNNIPLCFKALNLSKNEANYFESLVLFNQAKSIEDKNRYYQRLLNNKKVNMNLVNKDMYQFYSKWYHTAIRELLFYFPFNNNYRDIAKQLNPPISEDEAKKSIKLQEKLGFIKKNLNRYYQNSPTITTGDEVIQSMEIENYQIDTMNIAKNALNNTPAKLRDISTLTLSLSEKGFNNIKSLIQKTRKEILTEAQNDSSENRVYQVNFQLFPLTKEFKNNKREETND